MQLFSKSASKIHIFRNKITAKVSIHAFSGGDAQPLIEKVVYGTRIANDHILHELEARYGTVVAQHLIEKMPNR